MSYLSTAGLSRLSSRLFGNAVFSNTTASLLVKGSTIVSRLVVLVLLARLLSPAQYGSIIYALSIIEIIRQVAEFGMDTYAIRQLNVLGTAFEKQTFLEEFAAARLFLSITVYLLLICVAITGYLGDIGPIAILGVLVISGLWTNYAMNYFQSQLRVMTVVGATVGTNLVSVLLLFAITRIPNIPVNLLLFTLPLSEMVIAFILLFRLHAELPLKFLRWQPMALFALIRVSLPIAITSIIAMFYGRLDILLLNWLATSEAVGYYSVAARLIEPFLYIALYLSVSFYSVISAALYRDIKSAKNNILLSSGLILTYGVVACLFLQLAAPLVIKYLLPAYSPSLVVMRILAVLLVFRAINYGLTSFIQAFGKFTWITNVALWNLFFIGGSMLLLTPYAGITGTAIALLIGEALNTLIQLYLLSRLLNLQPTPITVEP